MDEKTKKLIAVGASVGANCHPCLEYHVGKALEAGIDRAEIREAAEVGKAVRAGAASSIDKLALNLIRSRLPQAMETVGECRCCS